MQCRDIRCIPWMQSRSAKQPQRKFIIAYKNCSINQKKFIFYFTGGWKKEMLSTVCFQWCTLASAHNSHTIRNQSPFLNNNSCQFNSHQFHIYWFIITAYHAHIIKSIYFSMVSQNRRQRQQQQKQQLEYSTKIQFFGKKFFLLFDALRVMLHFFILHQNFYSWNTKQNRATKKNSRSIFDTICCLCWQSLDCICIVYEIQLATDCMQLHRSKIHRWKSLGEDTETVKTARTLSRLVGLALHAHYSYCAVLCCVYCNRK